MIYIKRILLFICLFFLFNTLEVDSNSDKILIYDKDNLYEENNYNIYLYNVSSKELKSVLNILNIEVLSYEIDGNKYYAKSIDELENIFLKDKNISEQLYYSEYGINIDKIHVVGINDEIIKLDNLLNIY